MSGFSIILRSNGANSLGLQNYSNFSSEDLLKLVHDQSVHLFLRKPVLLELAKRREPRVLDICESMLQDSDAECWILALQALVMYGSKKSIDILYEEYLACPTDLKRFVALHIAQTVKEESRFRFQKVVRQFSCIGTLDVTGWTPTALDVLAESCKRLGITPESPVPLNQSKIQEASSSEVPPTAISAQIY
jgi:hypothetical protein